jgi:hypothetical protein
VKHFRNGLDRTVGQFYQWAYGDSFTNLTRAAIAEYLVACAIDREDIGRSSWGGYDLEMDGIKIEVKSSACFVSGKNADQVEYVRRKSSLRILASRRNAN